MTAVVMNEEALGVVTTDSLLEVCASIEDTLYEAGGKTPSAKGGGIAEIRTRLLHEADQLCHMLRGTQLPDGLLGELLDRQVADISTTLRYAVHQAPTHGWPHARHAAMVARTHAIRLRNDLIRIEGGGQPWSTSTSSTRPWTRTAAVVNC